MYRGFPATINIRDVRLAQNLKHLQMTRYSNNLLSFKVRILTVSVQPMCQEIEIERMCSAILFLLLYNSHSMGWFVDTEKLVTPVNGESCFL